MKKFIFVFLLSIPVAVSAQSGIKLKDIKIEDDVVYFQTVKQFIIQEKMMMTEIYIKDAGTQEVIISCVKREAPSPEGATKANPDGMDSYLEFTYLKSNAKCDYRPSGFWGKKDIAKDMLSYGIFENGVLNETNVNKFISIKGSPFTNRNNQTIIIR